MRKKIYRTPKATIHAMRIQLPIAFSGMGAEKPDTTTDPPAAKMYYDYEYDS